MLKNVGTLDKRIRIIVALVIAILYFTGLISGTLAYVLIAVGAILLITSLVNFCPLYALLRLNSKK
ncbi:YgaP family membrane protein [Flavobacteriaceae bacterium 14752]|uniref:YgaP family membrane protein n=1 Tax=Mesohalobacter salilacus TaxID=2491711 RepID=UPI000F62FC82|nr:DUF2892 domain-containing protein [Flavobacteriaceae bacterium 14752]